MVGGDLLVILIERMESGILILRDLTFEGDLLEIFHTLNQIILRWQSVLFF